MEDVAVDSSRRLRVRVSGLVQGVGFRPFVYRTADDLGLSGFVENNDRGVDIEVEGSSVALDDFLRRLRDETPPLATVTDVEVHRLAPLGNTRFEIHASERNGRAVTRIAPDAAVCNDCLRELFDPADRRYRYPFINCTNCGPRYTIVEGIPYDRPLTSMKRFAMCPECHREYHDPMDRRFHAQPNACPICGPRVWLSNSTGERVDVSDPIRATWMLLASGHIVAMKGLGGFHLAVDPHNDEAVRLLRLRKGRAEKPFALMARDLSVVFRYCKVTAAEERTLMHRARPIVLLEAREGSGLAASVLIGSQPQPTVPLREGAANTDVVGGSRGWSDSQGQATSQIDPRACCEPPRDLGFMLPYTPLHHLLLDGPLDALVMTSANLSEEPIAIGNDEAFERLGGIVDYFLVHDRDILQRCDDSVVRVTEGAMTPIRRSRGFVPDPVPLPFDAPRSVLACGGELKNTIGLARGRSVFLSQHIGDLDNPSAYGFFEHSIGHLRSILEIEPEAIAFDMHPDYLSTKWAREQDLPGIPVQHHHAHLAAVMAENGVLEPTIGIILDGTGCGTDGTIWGGEVLAGDLEGFERFAWLLPFRLPGGEAAIKHPWRTAYALLMASYPAGGVLDVDSRAKTPRRKDCPEPTPRVSTCLNDDAANLNGAGERSTAGCLKGLDDAVGAVDVRSPLEGSPAERGGVEKRPLSTPNIDSRVRFNPQRWPDDGDPVTDLDPSPTVAIPTWLADRLLPFKTARERDVFDQVIRRGINTPLTSSCGRLFDGVSALLGLCDEVTYEGQAAIALEHAARRTCPPSESPPGEARAERGRRRGAAERDDGVRSRGWSPEGPLDWTPIVRTIIADLHTGVPKSVIAKQFHLALSDLFVDATLRAREATGINRVGLSGGVFQNQLLLGDMRERLRRAGFEVLTHRLVPTNDGGLAYGQAAVAARTLQLERAQAEILSQSHKDSEEGILAQRRKEREDPSSPRTNSGLRGADSQTRRLEDLKT